jgi:hypothetical protein
MAPKAPDVMFETQVDVPQLTEPRWVRASETKPSLKGRRIAHHSNTYLLRPQAPEAIAAERAIRAGQPGADLAIAERRSSPTTERELFTEWAQGKGGEVYPENVGKLVMPGTKVGFQVHYHVGEEITDTLKWRGGSIRKGRVLATAPSTRRLAARRLGRAADPPNTVTEHLGTPSAAAPAILHNFQPHMHYRERLQTLRPLSRFWPRGDQPVTRAYEQLAHQSNYDPDYAPVFPKGDPSSRHHRARQYSREQEQPRSAAMGEWRDHRDEMGHSNEQIIYITE